MTAPSARVGATATTEQVDRFQLEVLAAINCEKLALQPGLSDELARGWVLCSLYSLYDAISLLPDVGLTGHGLSQAGQHLGLAKDEDFEALRKHPLDKAKIRTAIVYKRGALETVRKSGHRKLIIDVRGNAGGDVEEAIAAADELLTSGLITSLEGRRIDAKRAELPIQASNGTAPVS